LNIIEIITLNKHGDFQEVIFSSLMSYLLNPSADHRLNHLLLSKVVGQAFPEFESNWLEKVKVKSEYPLGNEGRVDIFIEMKEKALALEVKIWDQAAKNVSEAGISQVERYCDYLSRKYARSNWRFIYLIPTFDSPKCLSEFEKAYCKDYKENLRLMAWNPTNEESLVTSKFMAGTLVEKSVAAMIAEILENKEVKRTDIPLNTQWLLDSLQGFIPNLLQNVPDTVKFPTTADLEKIPTTWRIFDRLFTLARRWPSPILTTVGVPYGTGPDKATLHGNSLYRIRTTKDYYSKKEEKAKNLPVDKVELELWPDVYSEVQKEIQHWLDKLHLDKGVISESTHIDSKKNEPVILISFNPNISLSDNDISDFNAILRSGFDRVAKKLPNQPT
jgi:hypothetical protein